VIRQKREKIITLSSSLKSDTRKSIREMGIVNLQFLGIVKKRAPAIMRHMLTKFYLNRRIRHCFSSYKERGYSARKLNPISATWI
jgi:hypothetical protein